MSKLETGEGITDFNYGLCTQAEYARFLGIGRAAITKRIIKKQVNTLVIHGTVLIKLSKKEQEELLIKKENEETRHTI